MVRILILSFWIQLFVFLFPANCFSGEFLRFAVRDSVTGAPVSQVIIQNPEGRDLTISDSTGLAVLSVNHIPFPITLHFYRMDYQPFDLFLRECPPPDSLIRITLAPRPLPLSPVSVQSNLPEIQSDGSVILHPNRLNLIPFSQDDIYRMISIYPAAFTRSDYSSLFYVRGSTPDENMFYLDDVPMLNPYRIRLAMGGGTGILNSTQISSAEFYPGNFPVSFGGKAGALVSLKSRECLSTRLQGKFTLSPYESGIQLETPLPFRLKLNVAARISFLDWVIKKLDYANVIRPRFRDIQGNIAWQPNKNNHLKIGFILGDESVYLDMENNPVLTNSYYHLENSAYTHLLYFRHQWQVNPHLVFTHILALNQMKLILDDEYYEYDNSHNIFYASYGNNLDFQQTRYLIRQLFTYSSTNFYVNSGLGMELNHTKSNAWLGFYPYSKYMGL